MFIFDWKQNKICNFYRLANRYDRNVELQRVKSHWNCACSICRTHNRPFLPNNSEKVLQIYNRLWWWLIGLVKPTMYTSVIDWIIVLPSICICINFSATVYSRYHWLYNIIKSMVLEYYWCLEGTQKLIFKLSTPSQLKISFQTNWR